MEKAQLRKNRLDLEYHGEAQKINAYLILLTTGMLGFLGNFIWLKDKQIFYIGIFITLFLLTAGLMLYRKSMRKMRKILDEIEQLE